MLSVYLIVAFYDLINYYYVTTKFEMFVMREVDRSRAMNIKVHDVRNCNMIQETKCYYLFFHYWF
jgi:hypothetical protein